MSREETESPSALPNSELGKISLDAANSASVSARNAWLTFLGLTAYLLVTLAGVSHVDLLLNEPVKLPIVNVDIPVFTFFWITPYLFVLVHLRADPRSSDSRAMAWSRS